ncbi:MAG: zf-HC2 domain-containing protein [Clostridia bacterium]|nr:zf-HC2 domain-containing protein [Clostridia bacterium]
MSKINCSLIKDLLPLYVDDLCSKETTEIVGNHLEICEDCNKEYETLKTEPKVKPQQDNSQELIKKVNKKFGKDKKLAVIKTISIFLVVIIVVGGVALLKLPLYMAEKLFVNEPYHYMSCNYQKWETNNTEKSNYENDLMKLYIDDKYGEYKEEQHETVTELIFSDEKKIQICDFSTPPEKSSYSKESIFYLPAEYPILTFCVEKGLENMGFDTSVYPGYDMNVYYTLITRDVPWFEFFCSLEEYYDMCAYYALYLTIMPSGNSQDYYIVSETEDLIAWGSSLTGEDRNVYVMYFQTKGEYGEERALMVSGFTKEEAKEIFKYAVIK